MIGLFAGAALGKDPDSVDLSAYQWKNRLLLLFASSEEDQGYLTLKKEIDRQAMEVRDRDLLVFYVLERGESRLGQERLNPRPGSFLEETPLSALGQVYDHSDRKGWRRKNKTGVPCRPERDLCDH